MNRFINPVPQYILENGNLAAGGFLHLYISGTDEYLDLYADANGAESIGNPVELGSRGEVPNVYYEGTARAVLFDADGQQLFDVDPIQGPSGRQNFTPFDLNAEYSQGNFVLANDGFYYVSLVDGNIGNDPTVSPEDSGYWSQVAILELWNSQRVYTRNYIVFKAGVIYQSLTDDNQGQEPTATMGVYWRSIADAAVAPYSNLSSGLVAITVQVAIDELKALMDSLPAATQYRGVLNVSAGDSALPALPTNGDVYIIGVGGTITVSVNGTAPTPTAVVAGNAIIRNTAALRWDLIPVVNTAAAIGYNNVVSGLTATNVQLAIDELDTRADDADAAVLLLQSQISGYGAAIIYQGSLNVSAGDSALPLIPNGGDAYIIAVGGTITVSTAGATPVATPVTANQVIIYNATLNQWDLLPSNTTASGVSYDNSAGYFTGATVQDVIDETGAALIKPSVISATSAVPRTGNITDVSKDGTSDVVYTVTDSDYANGDIIRFRKLRAIGSLTVTTTGNQQTATGVLDTSSQFTSGAIGTLELVKTATHWAMRVY